MNFTITRADLLPASRNKPALEISYSDLTPLAKQVVSSKGHVMMWENENDATIVYAPRGEANWQYVELT